MKRQEMEQELSFLNQKIEKIELELNQMWSAILKLQDSS